MIFADAMELIGLFQEKSDGDYADIDKPLSILENKASGKKLSHDTRLVNSDIRFLPRQSAICHLTCQVRN